MSDYNTQVFHDGVNQIAALCVTLNHNTILNIPHNLVNAYKMVLALGLELDSYSWDRLQSMRESLQCILPKVNDIIDVKDRYNHEWYIGRVSKIEILNKQQYKLEITKCRCNYDGIISWTRYQSIIIHIKCQNYWIAPLCSHTPIHYNDKLMCYRGSENVFRCNQCLKQCCSSCNIKHECCSACIIKTEHDNIFSAIRAAVHYLYDEVIHCIIDYSSTGYIVECCNDLCKKQVIIQNKWEYLLPHRRIYSRPEYAYYHVFDIDVGMKDNIRNVYGDMIRIFCINCVDDTRCCVHAVNGCYKRDIEPFCMYHRDTYNAMHNAVSTGLMRMSVSDKSVIKLITDYSIGFIVECCNFENCGEEIAFDDMIQFDNDLDCDEDLLYKYPVISAMYDNRLNTVRIGDRLYRIFCTFCTQNGLLICSQDNCGNMDCHTICADHVYCMKCENYDGFDKCSQCINILCIKCSLKVVNCRGCGHGKTVYCKGCRYICINCVDHGQHTTIWKQMKVIKYTTISGVVLLLLLVLSFQYKSYNCNI